MPWIVPCDDFHFTLEPGESFRAGFVELFFAPDRGFATDFLVDDSFFNGAFDATLARDLIFEREGDFFVAMILLGPRLLQLVR